MGDEIAAHTIEDKMKSN